jgi:hypothetical protein
LALHCHLQRAFLMPSERSVEEQSIEWLLPYEQLFIQNYHHKGKLIPEQHRGEPNPLLQLACDNCTTART